MRYAVQGSMALRGGICDEIRKYAQPCADGGSGNGTPFPEVSKIVKLEWIKKKNPVSPFSVEIPDALKTVSFIEKDCAVCLQCGLRHRLSAAIGDRKPPPFEPKSENVHRTVIRRRRHWGNITPAVRLGCLLRCHMSSTGPRN